MFLFLELAAAVVWSWKVVGQAFAVCARKWMSDFKHGHHSIPKQFDYHSWYVSAAIYGIMPIYGRWQNVLSTDFISPSVLHQS